MEHTRRISEEVLYTTHAEPTTGSEELIALARASRETKRGRLRLCLHPDIDNPLHEMIIVHPRQAYVPPHKHHGQSESILVLQGRVDLVVFDDQGAVTRVVPMGAPESGQIFHHRLEVPKFHTLLIHSEELVFMEVRTGPYLPEHTEYASWAPASEQRELVTDYLGHLFSNYGT